MKTTLIASSGVIFALASAAPDPVRVWEEPLVLPTYEMGAPDRNPIFAERRAYQGAEAPVYPYPMWDAVTDRRVDRAYKAVYLENRYVQICVLPEIGGRVFSARDKTDGYDFLYRQHVIKPALIGMVGAWISGGIEWNIPHHHRASTFMKVDYSFSQSADGSAVVRVGELELRHRMRWVVELRLRPGSSCVEQTVRLINRTPQANSFLHFANIAVHANPGYQVIFPPDTRWVTNHGKREFSGWPASDSIYNGIDFRNGVDVSWWKNHPSPVSMFAFGSEMDFVAGYDHGKGAGFVHVADRHISPGKKFFTWGAGEAGRMWDRVLTDSDGPYIELMAGAYSDNQPDYSWIAPYQTKTAEAFWYPVARIGGVKNANRHAAVNLDVSGGIAKIAVAVTSEQPDLKVVLSCPAGVVLEKEGAAGPAQPFAAECKLPANAGRLTVRALGPRGELISYTMADAPSGGMPEPIRPPARPESIPNAEDLCLSGLRLEQLHSAALDPEDYYREALRRDPGCAKANTALGIRAYQHCRFAEAEKHLEAASRRATGLYLAPKDGEPHYHLGCALRALHKDREAREAFERAAWVAGWEAPARCQLAELRCADGDYANAAVELDRALAANSENVKALTLKAAVLRKLGRKPEADGLLARAASLDPLDPWPVWERALSGGGAKPSIGDDPQAWLEPAVDYAAAGLWDDAINVLSAATGKAAAHAMVKYFLAFYLEKSGKSEEAAGQYAAAAQLAPDAVFPFRRESIEVLRRARERNAGDARAAYYLGNVYMLHAQIENAIRQWEDARAIHPEFGLVHRNLALAYARLPGGLPKAVASMEMALQRDPTEPRYYLELDELSEAAGIPVEKRLALLERNQEVVARRDDVLAREAALLVEVGRSGDALKLLQGHQFHVWEGAGRTAAHNSHVDAHLALGSAHFAAGRHREALNEYEAALEYPPNLGIGRPVRGERLTEVYYRMAEACEALGEREAAARNFTLAVETAPAILAPKRPLATDEPEIYLHAARALEKLGRAPEAKEVYTGLVEAGQAQLADHVPMYFFASFGHPQPDPIRFAQANYVMGLGLLGSGKDAEATKAFDEAVRLNPNHVAARKCLRAADRGK